MIAIGPQRLALVLLAAAAVTSFGAWQIQSAAARALERAHDVQQRPVPEDDSPPPRVEDYRAVLDTLNESIEIRRDIDSVLAELESVVSGLREAQTEAERISDQAMRQLDLIAETLGGAATAAERATGRLGTLSDRLGTSARLARLIAEELEELDEKLGPSVGERP